jgi:hypothetical protein
VFENRALRRMFSLRFEGTGEWRKSQREASKFLLFAKYN